MVKINGRLTLLIGEEGLTIEIRDDDSGITFFRGKLNTKKTCQSLGRLASVEMEESFVVGLDKIGRKLEIDTLEFEIYDVTYEDKKEKAHKRSIECCPEGWEVDNYFNSQGSFFTKDDKNYARCTIRRWI